VIGKKRGRAEHVAGPDEPDDDLGAVAARLDDPDRSFDQGVGALGAIAL